MKNKQKAKTEWISDEGTCKMSIEVDGEITLDNVDEQWKGLMESVGYSMENY